MSHAFSQRDFTQFFVGLGVAETITASPNKIANLTDGEVGIFTIDGRRMTEALAATETYFMIVQGRGTNPPIVSGTINKNNLIDAKCTRKVYSAPTEQVDYIGYNTSSGSVAAIDDNLYYVRINLDQSKTSNHGGLYVKHGVYKSPISGTTQTMVVNALTENLVKNFSREKDQLIKFERVTSSTVTGATTGTLAVVNGSRYVTAATDIDNGGAVVGDYLVISGVAYKIVDINVGGAQVAELDIPYQGASDAAVADASVGFITAANAALGNWGIKMTAVAQTWTLGAINYNKTKWTLALENFDSTTTITNSTASFPGTGAYQQIAQAEWFYQGNEGTIYRNMVPTFTPRAVVTNQGYDQIVLTVEDTDNYPLGQTSAHKQYIIALPATAPAYAIAGTADDITDVLEVLTFGSANGNFAIS